MHQSPQLSPVALDVVSPGMSPRPARGRISPRESVTWPCCFVDGASPQRQARNTEPVPPHQYDKTRVSAKRRAPCLRREAIAASNVPRHRPNTLPFSRLSASCEDTNNAPTDPWHADVDREAAQWWRGSLVARFVRRRAIVRALVWPRTAKSSRPGPLLREKSEAGLRHESGGRRPRSAARRMPCCPSARYPMGASWPAVTDNVSSSGAGYRHPRVCRNARLGRLKYRPPRLKSSSWEMDVRSCCWRRRRHPGRCV